jgi:hypothetical protein
MKTKPIPAIIMLTAGLVTCIVGIIRPVGFFEFIRTLLIVLIIFYIAGCIVKVVLDRNFSDMAQEETTDGTEETTDGGQEGEESQGTVETLNEEQKEK